MKSKGMVLTAATAFALAGQAATAQTKCDAVERLQANETLEQLATRCGMSVDALLRANGAATAAELSQREAIAVPQDKVNGDWLDRARNAVSDAGRELDDAATAAGRSVTDYLKDKPDLNRDVLSLGEKLGLPGVSASPSTGPALNVTIGDGDTLMVSASGLPGAKDVVFGWLEGDTMKPLETLRTDDSGRLKATVDRPATLQKGGTGLFVLETTDKKLRLASDPVASN